MIIWLLVTHLKQIMYLRRKLYAARICNTKYKKKIKNKISINHLTKKGQNLNLNSNFFFSRQIQLTEQSNDQEIKNNP